jgi:uncharacterized alkaline shock family protein YloU
MFRIFFGILLIASGGWIFLLATGWHVPYVYTIQAVDWFRSNPLQSIVTALCLVLGGFVLLRIKRFALGKPFRFRLKSGELRINRDAVKDIVRKNVSEMNGLEEAGILIRAREKGLEIKIFCRVAADCDLSLLSERIGERVSRDVEQYSGLKVKAVKVLKK